MATLDLEALLELNPQVDRDAIKKRRDKILKEGSRGAAQGADSTSPYGGKRLTADDKMKWPVTKTARRSHYSNI